MDLQSIFSEAVRLHQLGQLTEAEQLYLQVLHFVPENRSLLANLGIVCRDLGKFAEAETYCRKALAAAPDDPEQHLNLGAVLEAKGDLAGATAACEKAYELAPTHPKVLNNFGKLLYQQGLADRGRQLIERAIEIVPNYPLALNNLGVICSEAGDLSRAGWCLEKSVELDPGNVEALYNLAGVCNALNNFDKAVSLLDRLLALAPQHHAARHMRAALSGTTTSAAPREYVEATFDKYAGRFDEHIQHTLGYTAPSALAELVKTTMPEALPFPAALDIGCGTGLSGLPFRPMTDRLVGVDISSRMLAQARAKKIYDHLEHAEVMPFLATSQECYDLFIAADVFIYLGDIQPLFPLLAARAGEHGLIACSIETSDLPGYQLLPSGRYAHNPDYLRQCAAAAGFAVRSRRPHNIRREKGGWLPGELLLLVKNL